jgi:hypothetical protein
MKGKAQSIFHPKKRKGKKKPMEKPTKGRHGCRGSGTMVTQSSSEV